MHSDSDNNHGMSCEGQVSRSDYVKNLNKSEPALRLGSWFATSLNKTKQGKNSKSIFQTACPYWYLFTATALSTHRSDSRVSARMRTISTAVSKDEERHEGSLIQAFHVCTVCRICRSLRLTDAHRLMSLWHMPS